MTKLEHERRKVERKNDFNLFIGHVLDEWQEITENLSQVQTLLKKIKFPQKKT